MKDPFTRYRQFLGYRRLNSTRALIYSIGPDGKDDGGYVVYDITNGTTSGGDIVRTIGNGSP
jgi:hypothetical protein